MKWLNSHSSGADGGPRRINRAACRRQADFDREILDANTLDEQRTAGRGRRYPPVKSSESYGQRNSFVYGALVVVCFLYFYRPDDIVVPLGEFVTGGH